MHTFRTHTCGGLGKSDVGQKAKLAGWIHSVRDHGGVIFIDLRDHYGKTQVVVNPKMDFYQELEKWRVETVVGFTGTVVARTPETVNPKLATGEIELVAEEMAVLGETEQIPFQVAKDEQAPEALRLEYRFLDLRREELHNNIVLRVSDADPDQQFARRRTRLSRAEPRSSRSVLRSSAESPAVQAAADGCRIRQVFPGRALLP